MTTLTEIINSVINGINRAISFAAPFADGSPLDDADRYSLDDFPQIDDLANAAYDLGQGNEEIRETVETIVEASDRISALYTMLCDLIPARDAHHYDYGTVSMVLPYFTFTINALSDIVDELGADVVMMQAEPAPIALSDNVMFKRIFAFVVEGLGEQAKAYPIAAGFRVYALRQLVKFEHGEEADPFDFFFVSDQATLTCTLDSDELELSKLGDLSIRISRNGDVSGSMDSSDLKVDGMRLVIERPEEFEFKERE